MTSKPGGRPVVRLATDANVLLSAVFGRAAMKALVPSFPVMVDLVIPENVLAEVREHLAEFAEHMGVAPGPAKAALDALEIEPCPLHTYEDRLEEARSRIGERAPDDVDLLALALALRIPIWSNDNDFEKAGVEWYTTARLLAKYGVFGK